MILISCRRICGKGVQRDPLLDPNCFPLPQINLQTSFRLLDLAAEAGLLCCRWIDVGKSFVPFLPGAVACIFKHFTLHTGGGIHLHTDAVAAPCIRA